MIVGGIARRHLAAAQFVHDQRDAVALVASQDGFFTLFAWSVELAMVHAAETLVAEGFEVRDYVNLRVTDNTEVGRIPSSRVLDAFAALKADGKKLVAAGANPASGDRVVVVVVLPSQQTISVRYAIP